MPYRGEIPQTLSTSSGLLCTSLCRAPTRTHPHLSHLQGERTCPVFDVKNLHPWQEHSIPHDHVRDSCPKHSSVLCLCVNIGAPQTPLVRTRTGPEARSTSGISSFDLSDESVETLLKELQIEERIVDAARRMADMPAGNRKERQQRRRSLQQ